MRYNFERLREKIILALDIFFKNDDILLGIGVSERSISHKLAEYLQIQFPEWHVDCEYNRKERDIKRLEGIKGCDEQKTKDRIFPDIIVHHRYREDNGEYGYDWGLYIQFNILNKPRLIWYKDGKVYEEN